ncbi:MAG: HlyD family efflux transporter periplasmic adaptor subunit [Planctomycetes bacterium]|nr:HlyD family efflux transporter periplasmic adaptor subunit [Planctomycetota bacterium]
MKYLKNKRNVAIAVCILILLFIWITGGGDSNSTNTEVPLFTVEQGPLTISVLESGTITAREVEIIKCQVEGISTVLSLIAEATHVKKGDVLMELDSSKLVEREINQNMAVKDANSVVIVAEKAFDVVKEKTKSDIAQANLMLRFAGIDLRNYKEKEYLNEHTAATTRITLAKEELSRAEVQLENSKKLAAENYISSTELKTDELTYKKAELELTLVKNQLDLLENYMYDRNIEQLESNVKQAVMGLNLINISTSASLVQAEAELVVKQAMADKQVRLLEKINDQIKKTVIRAPMDGMVIYATSAKRTSRFSNREPLDEGQSVRERMELIYLPTSDLVNVEAKIHEANLDKVKIGFPVTIKIDAIPGEVFTGTVNKIAILPDQRSMHMNPDLKVYDTVVFVDDKGPNSASQKVRTGMGCRIEILTAEFEDALYVPIQSVIMVGDQPTVYVQGRGKPKPRKVEIGMDNNRMVRIITGLKKGEKVLLAPPLAEAEVRDTRKAKTQELAPPQEEHQEEPQGDTPPRTGRGDREGGREDRGQGQRRQRPSGE